VVLPIALIYKIHDLTSLNDLRIKYNLNDSDQMNLLSRITIDKDVCHGKPCIRNMRWPVEVIIDMLGSEMSIQNILEDHPELEK
jgi:uncharacterized protein (DUF433 family)